MYILLIVVILVGIVYAFMQQTQFGKLPEGSRKERVLASPHYQNNQFQNRSHTPALAEGVSYGTVMKEFFFGRRKDRSPASPIPSVKTDLKTLPADDLVVWFGHSSYLLQLSGRTFLVDPVFSGSASPLRFTINSFPGTDRYTIEDLPSIDYLLLTHDHWDHLDYRTVRQLKDRVKRVVTGLGVGAHLENWGFEPGKLEEKDWDETVVLDEGFTLHTATARHFSGRSFRRNTSLWTSMILQTPGRKLYLGGDSGYDSHFRSIGAAHGPFDLAILECGQYDPKWKYIHMMPEETVQAALDLGARRLLPVHWGKFALANHAWNDPILRVEKEAALKGLPLLHPPIGEPLLLDDPGRQQRWWDEA